MAAKRQSENRQRFVASANRRVNFAIIEIAKIGKVATPSHEYDQKDIDNIIGVLSVEVAKLRTTLESHGSGPSVIRVIPE